MSSHSNGAELTREWAITTDSIGASGSHIRPTSYSFSQLSQDGRYQFSAQHPCWLERVPTVQV